MVRELSREARPPLPSTARQRWVGLQILADALGGRGQEGRVGQVVQRQPEAAGA